jgi:Tfp pilus assembly protein PilO
MPVILIGVAATFFFVVTNPLYNSISAQKLEGSSYNDALNTSKELQSERDQLTAKYNNIDPDDLAKLEKLLPDSVNNIRLVLEIEQIASPYNMTLSDVKYNATDAGDKTSTDTTAIVQGEDATQQSKDYGIFNLEFSTTGTYDDFMNFTKDLENNLRIVDISSIAFDTSVNANPSSKTNSGIYRYDFKIKTYWLKN